MTYITLSSWKGDFRLLSKHDLGHLNSKLIAIVCCRRIYVCEDSDRTFVNAPALISWARNVAIPNYCLKISQTLMACAGSLCEQVECCDGFCGLQCSEGRRQDTKDQHGWSSSIECRSWVWARLLIFFSCCLPSEQWIPQKSLHQWLVQYTRC